MGRKAVLLQREKEEASSRGKLLALVDGSGGRDRGCVERARGTGPTWCSLRGNRSIRRAETPAKRSRRTELPVWIGLPRRRPGSSHIGPEAGVVKSTARATLSALSAVLSARAPAAAPPVPTSNSYPLGTEAAKGRTHGGGWTIECYSGVPASPSLQGDCEFDFSTVNRRQTAARESTSKSASARSA